MGRNKKDRAQMYKNTGFVRFIARRIFCFILNKGENQKFNYFFSPMISIKIFQPCALVACGISRGVVVY